MPDKFLKEWMVMPGFLALNVFNASTDLDPPWRTSKLSGIHCLMVSHCDKRRHQRAVILIKFPYRLISFGVDARNLKGTLDAAVEILG